MRLLHSKLTCTMIPLKENYRHNLSYKEGERFWTDIRSM